MVILLPSCIALYVLSGQNFYKNPNMKWFGKSEPIIGSTT